VFALPIHDAWVFGAFPYAPFMCMGMIASVFQSVGALPEHHAT